MLPPLGYAGCVGLRLTLLFASWIRTAAGSSTRPARTANSNSSPVSLFRPLMPEAGSRRGPIAQGFKRSRALQRATSFLQATPDPAVQTESAQNLNQPPGICFGRVPQAVPIDGARSDILTPKNSWQSHPYFYGTWKLFINYVPLGCTCECNSQAVISRMLVAAFFLGGSAVKRPRPAGLHRSGAEDDEVLVDENAPPRSIYEAGRRRVSRRRD